MSCTPEVGKRGPPRVFLSTARLRVGMAHHGVHLLLALREEVPAAVNARVGRAKQTIDPRIAWAKLKSLSEGAAIASKKLWH